MKAFVLTVFYLVSIVVAGFGGYYLSDHGYRVVTPDNINKMPRNAADIVKEENVKLGRAVVGMMEAEAIDTLKANNRTMFVGVRDGSPQEYKGQKTFTNLTVEIKDGRVLKVMGWY